MSGQAKFGIAFALIFVALATAPAVQCLSYLAQTDNSPHSCCHQKPAPASVIPTCCIHSPALTSHSFDVVTPMIAVATSVVIVPIATYLSGDLGFAAVLDTSPPDCSSILRI